MKARFFCFIVLTLLMLAGPLSGGLVQKVIDFEDVGLSGPNQSWAGVQTTGKWNGGFESGGASFSTNTAHDPWYGYDAWYGFGYSNKTNNSYGQASYQNAMVAIPGKGGPDIEGNNSSTYAVAYWTDYDWIEWKHISDACKLILPEGALLESLQVTNTSYAYYSMLYGDEFNSAIKSGQYLTLNIEGRIGDMYVNDINVNLADYQSGPNVLADWLTVNLTSLGASDTLVFSLNTNIADEWGITVPTYFALDNITYWIWEDDPNVVPEPATLVIIGLAGLSGLSYRKLRRNE